MELWRSPSFCLLVALVLVFSSDAWAFWGIGPAAVVRPSVVRGSRMAAPASQGLPQLALDRSRVSLQMSDTGFGTGTQKKGGVKVGVKEREDTKTSPKEKEKFEVEWRVLLHNDDVHTFDYVSRQLAEVIPTLTRSKAWECTLAAHSNDYSTLAIVTKSTAEEYCMKLQKEGLTISVAPDSNFEKNEDK